MRRASGVVLAGDSYHNRKHRASGLNGPNIAGDRAWQKRCEWRAYRPAGRSCARLPALLRAVFPGNFRKTSYHEIPPAVCRSAAGERSTLFGALRFSLRYNPVPRRRLALRRRVRCTHCTLAIQARSEDYAARRVTHILKAGKAATVGGGMSGIPVLHVEADCIARAWEAVARSNSTRNGCIVQTAIRQARRSAQQRRHHDHHRHRPAQRADDPQGFPGRPRRVAGIRHGSLRGHQGPPRARPQRSRRTPLGIHLPPAPVRLRRALAQALRPDRDRSARSWPRPRTPAAPRPSPGRFGKTTTATTPPACRASGAESRRRTASRCSA